MEVSIKLAIFFNACVENILLYGSEAWISTSTSEDRINGCYTQLLRRVFGVRWQDHMTNSQLYGVLPPLSTVLGRRLHVSKLVFWQPRSGKDGRERKALTYPPFSPDMKVFRQLRSPRWRITRKCGGNM